MYSFIELTIKILKSLIAKIESSCLLLPVLYMIWLAMPIGRLKGYNTTVESYIFS